MRVQGQGQGQVQVQVQVQAQVPERERELGEERTPVGSLWAKASWSFESEMCLVQCRVAIGGQGVKLRLVVEVILLVWVGWVPQEVR